MYDYRFLQVIDNMIAMTEQPLVKQQLPNNKHSVLEAFVALIQVTILLQTVYTRKKTTCIIEEAQQQYHLGKFSNR